MNARLQLLFDTLETERLHLLDEVAKLSSEQFYQAEPGKWSVAQILAHLVAAEKLSIRYINKKISGIHDLTNTGITEELKMILLKISQRLPFKFKAPKVVVENTLSFSSLEELKAAWETERNELKILLEKFEDAQVNRKIYRHVRAGLLNIQQALIFFVEHHRHHLPQIKRLISRPT